MKKKCVFLFLLISNFSVLAQFNRNTFQLNFYGASNFKDTAAEDFTKTYFPGAELRYSYTFHGSNSSNLVMSGMKTFRARFAVGAYLAYEAKSIKPLKYDESIDSNNIDNSFQIFRTGTRTNYANFYYGPSFSFLELNNFVSIQTTLSLGLMNCKKYSLSGTFHPQDTTAYKSKILGVAKDGTNRGYFADLKLCVVFHFDVNFGLSLHYGVTYFSTLVKAKYFEEYNTEIFVNPQITKYTDKLSIFRQSAGIGIYYNF